MPPTTVHFNGGVNLPDTETVMREIATRVPAGVRRIPDGETGNRQNWIWFQLEKFQQTPGLAQEAAVGLHLCYGDYQHHHFKQPESFDLQVRVSNAVVAAAGRTVNWLAFTVPQNRGDGPYFEPLRELSVPVETEVYLALVPYHPAEQEPGTVDEQVRLIDSVLDGREWGICTECGMARAERDEVPELLDLHRQIIGARTP